MKLINEFCDSESRHSLWSLIYSKEISLGEELACFVHILEPIIKIFNNNK
jgi:hypothetical protein